MPTGLERRNAEGGIHFVTVSCFRRKPLLGTEALRDLFQSILFETRDKYSFELKAYVVMPEHVHLVFRPEGNAVGTILQVLKQRYSVAMILQVLKQRYSVAMRKAAPVLYLTVQQRTAHPPPMPVWETRYYDFDLDDPGTTQQKIDYIHDNPVKRELVSHASDWKWSSYNQHQKVFTYQR